MKKEKKTKIQKMHSKLPDTKRKPLRVKKTYISTSRGAGNSGDQLMTKDVHITNLKCIIPNMDLALREILTYIDSNS